jgi:hypothetical protein
MSLALLTTTGYWLATSGVSSPTISPLPGTSSSGEVATVTPMTSAVTRSNGSAQLQVGVALAKIVIASTLANHFRLHIAWTNAQQAGQVLNSPNAQVSMGVYHPIHTGNCNATNSTNVDAPLVNITDPANSATYCGALDQSATGSGSVSSTGKLMLATGLFTGFLSPALAPGGSISSCAASGVDTGSWCQPSSVTSSTQRALFLVASVVTPGAIPQGQQSSLSSLYFFEEATQVG